MASQRIPDDVRTAVAERMRTRRLGKPTVAEIAAEFGISPRSVQVIANAAGVVPAAARAATENATAQTRATNAEQRAELSQMFLAAARRALGDMEQPAMIFNFGGKDNTYNERTVERPPTADQRNLMIIAATAFDKHLRADLHDGASDNSDVAKVLAWWASGGK